MTKEISSSNIFDLASQNMGFKDLYRFMKKIHVIHCFVMKQHVHWDKNTRTRANKSPFKKLMIYTVKKDLQLFKINKIMKEMHVQHCLATKQHVSWDKNTRIRATRSAYRIPASQKMIAMMIIVSSRNRISIEVKIQ